MAWVQTLSLSALKNVGRHTDHLNGKEVLILWHQDAVHAIQAKCPHFKLPLLKGQVTEDCAIVCPFHKSAFDLKTGCVAAWSPWPPVVGKVLGKVSKEKPLTVYPTRIEDDFIWVDV